MTKTFEGVNQQRFLLITQELQIEALVFFKVRSPSLKERAQAAVTGYRVAVFLAGALTPFARALAVKSSCVSRLRQPPDRVTGFSSYTVSACIGPAFHPKSARFLFDYKA
jgi:hypothetical protein